MTIDMEISLSAVREAAQVLKGVIHETNLTKSETLSNLVGVNVYLKEENLQKTGSYKIRGAFVKMNSLSDNERSKGVVCSSAGNHAQGVAFAAQAAGIRSVVVMPSTSPLSKITATRQYGASVVLHGNSYDEAYKKAREIEEQSSMTFIHAFNDPYVMAGQGTVALEIVRQLPTVDVVVVPIGGGGLISGVATVVKSLCPNARVIGVQSEACPAMFLSKAAGSLQSVPLSSPATIAEGINVKTPGERCFQVVQRLVDDIVLIDDESIAAAMVWMLERCKLLVEAAGAAGIAALMNKKVPLRPSDKNVVVVVCGGNVDVNFLARVIERGMCRSGRRLRFSTLLSDRPGELSNLLTLIGKLEGNVANLFQQRDVALGRASVDLTLETRDQAHAREILDALGNAGYSYEVLLRAVIS
mmetsp:Transcript_17692/g.29096  ORF Transcript_17692/g.29096 Transcript_17692/m.29096 type:complete len:414 (+) Transcript_17692:735-1976(+)